MIFQARCIATRVLVVAATFAPCVRAHAQMIPVSDDRTLNASAWLAGGVPTDLGSTPAVPFSWFQDFLDAYVEGPNSATAEATATQVSQFFPNAITGSGDTWGAISGPTFGNVNAQASTRFRFRVQSCVSFTLDATVSPADLSNSAPPTVRLSNALSNVPYAFVENDGHLVRTGRLSPGEYDLEGFSVVNHHATLSAQGGAYSMLFLCTPCPTPLIAAQPADVVAPNGSTVHMTVTPTSPGPALSVSADVTYQWRKNMSALTDGLHVNGATTGTLTIVGATAADTGYYDVVLTSGAVEEPSRFAHLTLSSTTDVAPGAAHRGFALEAPRPNPSRGPIEFRFAADRPAEMTVAIYDAAGRIVVPLAGQVAPGPGSFVWDGRDATGAPAPAGMYFLFARLGRETQTRRFVRLP